ncbi:hypothetical protein MANES_15G022650v8 [Manihot esculenta]|uniref:Uncharacterized protein n=1 Tax=Manihot esculenta TaxID=3983 RepID=A0ACB7G8W2_MANES|nr:hypothetical protein MANES_15G022650v8 [Manihot esculenta]
MAMLYTPPVSSALLPPRVLFPNSKSLLSTPSNPFIFSISCSISTDKRYPSRRINCSGSSSSIESHQPPSTIVFVKGLPLSTSEGSLKKSFSQFGEVNRAKIVSDKKTKQSLGSAFVWFTNEDSAKLAVKEMDGKVFNLVNF